MGELTSCNFCDYSRIRASVSLHDSQIILEPSPVVGGIGGTTLYVRPLTEKLDKDKHFKAWFMQLTDHCVC